MFEALLLPIRKKKTACILCLENIDENKPYTCELKIRSEVEWNSKTTETIRAATHVQSFKERNATKPVPVDVKVTLSVFSMSASWDSIKTIDVAKTAHALQTETFVGNLNARYKKIASLRRIFDETVTEASQSYHSKDNLAMPTLTQQEEEKSVFPTHITVVDAQCGQVVIEQMFSIPHFIELDYLSVAAHRRLKRIAKQNSSAGQRDRRTDAVGNTVNSFARGNTPRRKNDAALTKSSLKVPSFIPESNRSSDEVQTYKGSSLSLQRCCNLVQQEGMSVDCLGP